MCGIACYFLTDPYPTPATGMLNAMSERSEYEYSEFVQNQFDAAKAAEAEEAEAGGSGKSEKGQFFRPLAGLCFETSTVGGDGLKVRMLDSQSSSGSGEWHACWFARCRVCVLCIVCRTRTLPVPAPAPYAGHAGQGPVSASHVGDLP